MKILRGSVVLLGCLGAFSVSAAKYRTIGNWRAPQKGTVGINLGGEPLSLHPWVARDRYSAMVQRYVLDSLLHKNLETGAYEPGLARAWSANKEGTRFTFTLRNEAKWHDGKPVKISDVKYSFDQLSAAEFPNNVYRSFVRSISSARIVGSHTIRFTTSKPYPSAIDVLANFPVVPKHVYNKEERSRLSRIMVGSGPYVLSKYARGDKITLKRNPGWWGRKENHLRGYANFRKVYLHFISNEETALERLKDGKIDFTDLSPEGFVSSDARGDEWGVTLTKREIEAAGPLTQSFVAWNNQSPLFNDVRVRRAMAHLFNRTKWNERYFEGKRKIAAGPWARTSESADPK
jgi:microcin C transport system substrate-binding protein